MSETAHDRLAQLRQQLAEQRAREDKLRSELAVAQNALHVAVTDMKEAYAEEDEKLRSGSGSGAWIPRTALAELSNRVSGAEVRTTRAEEMVSNFKRERAGELLRELEEAGKVDTWRSGGTFTRSSTVIGA